MAHLHPVYDDDPHFSINSSSREITYESKEKLIIIQGDHNSERYTFEIPKTVDGHDMTLCDLVQVHYINIDSGNSRERNTGLYKVDDVQVSPDDENTLVFSWLISQNATKLVGSLNFVVRFACTSGSKIDYSWSTSVFSSVTIATSIDNAGLIVEQYADVLESWYMELLSAGTMGVNIVTDTANKALEDIKTREQNAANSATEAAASKASAKEYADSAAASKIAAAASADEAKGYAEEIKGRIDSAAYIEDGTGAKSLQQSKDPKYTGVAIKSKNPKAYAFDNSLTDNEPIGATGDFSAEFGGNSSAQGKRSFANGTSVVAKGNYSHAEGDNSVALGNDSHAEGYMTTAKGNMSHSEGGNTVAEGTYSHAEGLNTNASGLASHAEGTGTTASGDSSLSVGNSSTASGTTSFAAGKNTIASGTNSATFGYNNKAIGDNSFVTGNSNTVNGMESHAEGTLNTIDSSNAHAEGYSNKIYTFIPVSSGGGSGSSGGDTPTIPSDYSIDDHKGENSHTEGWSNQTLGFASHAEGGVNKAWGHFSHVEGTSTITGSLVADGNNYKIVGGLYAHAEGVKSTATGLASHAEGGETIASGKYSHAQGEGVTAKGIGSDAGGSHAIANGDYSLARGSYTVTRKRGQSTLGVGIDSGADSIEGGLFAGQYNDPKVNAIFQIGNGTTTKRSNALTIFADGSAEFVGAVKATTFNGSLIGNASTATKATSATSALVANRALTADAATTATKSNSIKIGDIYYTMAVSGTTLTLTAE